MTRAGKHGPPIFRAPELCRLSAADLVEAYGAGELSPVEVTEAVLDHIDAADGALQAFRFVDVDGARRAALASERRWRAGRPLGPIDGVPTTIKDLVRVGGWVVRYGSTTTDDVPCEADAPAVARLRGAGAVLLGLTTTPEFGWKAVTDSELTGITRNPWNTTRTPGGSSGGAAAAAAAGMGALHLGTDGGGSIRVPCAFTGTVGIKPTFGRVPAYPLSPFGTVSHLGPMTRTVADSALMLAVMAGPDPRDWHTSWAAAIDLDEPETDLRERRVGVWMTPPTGAVAADVEAAFAHALEVLADLGVEVVPLDLPSFDLAELFRVHWYLGASRRLASVPARLRGRVDAGLREVAEAGDAIDRTTLLAAEEARAHFGAAMDALLAEEVDFVVSPATAITAFAAGHEVPPGSGLERWTEWAGFSYPINLSQQPAVVVPSGLGAAGMPTGLQIVGARGADVDVLGAALAFELAT